ncbi:MAG: ABC transporter substrate-binding protein [Actinobacteria bacterium]|nr:ABC transporter substrate-binding protein [Actinomycetota bacterium]
MRLPVIAVVAAVVLLAGCSTPQPTPVPSFSASAAPKPGDGTLRIGTLFPVTGAASYIAPAQAAGVALAIADVNAAGGVAGMPLDLLARDSGEASGTTLETSFSDLVAGGVDVVIGPSSSLLAARAIPLAATAGIALISPAATFPSLTTAADDGYFFRTIPAYGHQGLALGEVLSESGPERVALLYIDDEFGRALAPTLAQGLEQHGSTLALSQGIPVGTTDLSIVIDQVKAAAPDAVVLGSTYASVDATKALITAVIAAGYGGSKLWLTTQNTGDYSQALPGGTLTGVNGIIEGFQPDDAFIARLKTVDSSLTAYRYAAEAYDAVILAALAAVQGGDAGSAIAENLGDVSVGGLKCGSFAECLTPLQAGQDIDYDGVSGPLNFTPEGDISPAYYGLYTYDGENRFVFSRGLLAG